jgi:hypothetical protein
MRAWRGAAAFSGILPVAASATTAAGAPSAAQTTGEASVDVVIVSDAGSAPAMRAVVVELIARLRLAATVTFAPSVNPVELINPVPGAEPRMARVWIDLSKPDRATLYLVDREWERILIRHVRKMPGHEEIAREAVGHILETAVDALAHGARIGITREDARAEIEKASAPVESGPTSAPAPAAPGPRLEFGAMYEAELYATGGVVAHGPGGSFYVGRWGGAVRPGGWLTLQYRLPVIVDAAPVGVRLDGATARALAAIDLAVSRWLAVRLAAGAGVDVLHMTPRLEGAPGTTRGTDEDFALVVGRLSGGLSWSPTTGVALVLVVSCDLDPSGSRYVGLVDGSRAAVLTPWPVRPALSVGVSFEPFL